MFILVYRTVWRAGVEEISTEHSRRSLGNHSGSDAAVHFNAPLPKMGLRGFPGLLLNDGRVAPEPCQAVTGWLS